MKKQFLRLKTVHELAQRTASKVAELIVIAKLLMDKGIVTTEEVEEEFKRLHETSETKEIQEGP